MSMKTIREVTSGAPAHWVGNGFPVRSLFTYDRHGEAMSPFLLLDHAGPRDFPPGRGRRGVGEHPHRGFETVTLVYEGEVSHRDTAGNGGTIGPGDVQWMTAGAGLLHEEYHSERFTRAGGRLHMVQLWVNLPARDKGTEPAYQAISDAEIPSVALPDEAGRLRVIAGEHDGRRGPARTHTPMAVWDVQLHAGRSAALTLPDGWTAGLAILAGTVLVNDEVVARQDEMVVLGRAGRTLRIEADPESRLLLLGGEPIDEAIVGHGPFVMNSEAEIVRAVDDYRSGRFGHLPR